MRKNVVALLHPNAFRVYIVFTPSAMFGVRNNEPKVHSRIALSVAEGNYQARFADRELIKSSRNKIVADDQLGRIAKREMTLLDEKFYGSVWLYGDSTSDYTLHVVNTALRKKTRLINLAERGSLLDRYLESWIRRFGTLA